MAEVEYTRQDVFDSPWQRTPGHSKFLEQLSELVLLSGRFECRLTELVLLLDRSVIHKKTAPPNDVSGKLKFLRQYLPQLNKPDVVALLARTEAQYQEGRELRNMVAHGKVEVFPLTKHEVVFSIEKFDRDANAYTLWRQKLRVADLLEAANAFHRAEKMLVEIIKQVNFDG